VLAVAVAAGLAAGCRLPAKPAGGAPPEPPAAPPAEVGKHLLIGPDGGQTPPTELAPKPAALACFKAAQQMEANGQTEEAAKLYEKARSLDPAAHTAAATRRLAVVYDRLGEFTKSAAEYEAAVKAAPTDADLLNDLGYSHYSRGESEKAVAALRKAVELKPDHKRAWMNLGLALALGGRFAESYEAFAKAGKPAEACCNLAFALAAQGRTEEAKTEYRKAIELDPGLKLARAALAKLENPAPVAKEDAPKRPSRPATPAPSGETPVSPDPLVEVVPAEGK
jgi:tetratricopeptide (TPR) repeat protein